MNTSRRRATRLLCGAIALAAANSLASEALGVDVVISDFEPGGTYYGGTEAWFGYGAAGTGTGTPTGGTSNWFWATPNQYYGSITNQSWANPDVSVNSFNSNSHLQFDLLVPTGGPDAWLPNAVTTISIEFQFGGGSSGTVNQTLQTTFDSSVKNTVIPIDVSYASLLPFDSSATFWNLSFETHPGYDFGWDPANPSAVPYDTKFYIDNVRLTGGAPVVDAHWLAASGSGNWSEAAKWTPGVPQFSGDQATFDAPTAPTSVTADISVALTGLTINGGGAGNNYTINGPGIIGLDTNATLAVNSGHHTINTTVNMNGNNRTFTVAPSSSLAIANLTGGGFGNLNVNGGGTLTVNQMANYSLTADGTTVNISAGAPVDSFLYGITLDNGAILNLSGNSVRNNAIYGNGTVNLGSGGVLKTGFFGDYTFAGTIAGAGDVVVGGESATPHTVAFTGVNTYSGTTTVTNGNTLEINSAASLGDGSATNDLILDGGTLRAAASFTSGRDVSAGGSGGTIDTNGQSISFGSAGSGSLTKTGAGTLTVANARGTILNVSSGITRVAPDGGASGVGVFHSLTVDPAAGLDMTDNDLVVQNGAFTDVQALVLAGFGGTTAIHSSTSDGSQILALFDNAQVGAGDWLGHTLSGNAIVGKYTFFGDVNIDGQVSGDDYTVIDANLNTDPAVGIEWLSGDANLDGVVTGDDYTVIDANLGAGSGNPLSSSSLTAVPEPVSGVLIAGGVFGMLASSRRRRRSQEGY